MMRDTERLTQLIAEAKAHRAAQQQHELDEFRHALEETITPEVYGLLEVACELDRNGRNPKASFSVGPWMCTVIRSHDEELGHWHLEMHQTNGATSGRSFDNQDELLLIVDELYSKQ